MDREIVSFIESIQPDFSYQGTTGMLKTIIESNENMIAIDNYISTINEEAYNESLSDKFQSVKTAVGNKINDAKNVDLKAKAHKAYEFIKESIKRAIAKIKALFMTQYKKVKILYVKALEKITPLLTKLGASQNREIPYEFENLDSGELLKYINSFNSRNIIDADALQINIDTNSAAQKKYDTENMDSADSMIRSALAGTDGQLSIKDIENLKTTLKDKCFTKFTKINIGKNALKVYFDESVSGPLNTLYKNILNNEAEVMRLINKLESGGKYSEVSIKYANKFSSTLQSANIKFFDAVLGVAVTGMNNYVRAIVAAIKANAGSKVSSAKDAVAGAAGSVADKASELKNKVTGNNAEPVVK